jgi:hypothetical protein
MNRNEKKTHVTHPSWGPWVYDPSDHTLNHGPVTDWVYFIDLREITTSAQMLDWIFQIAGKTWGTPAVVGGLVQAFEDLLNPQGALCSFGMERGPIRVRDHIASLRRLRQLFYWRDTEPISQTTAGGLVVINGADLCPPPTPDSRPELNVGGPR